MIKHCTDISEYQLLEKINELIDKVNELEEELVDKKDKLFFEDDPDVCGPW